MTHITVLKEEAVSALSLEKDSVAVDCTLGAGGHASGIIAHLGKQGVFVGFDADVVAIDAFASTLQTEATVHLLHVNFSHIKEEMTKLQLQPTAILADLGWRTDQFEAGNKGFSFQNNEPLVMTFGNPKEYQFTAHTIVNEWAEESIADIIYGYGEEQFSRRIAKAIIEAREQEEIKSTGDLVSIIEGAVPNFYRKGRLHPGTKTFQALRIAVNDELGTLKTLLSDGFACLAPGGVMAIISFHSLEDRIVKQFFQKLSHDQKGTRITKKPIVASKEELRANPRSRSAKLRVFKKND